MRQAVGAVIVNDFGSHLSDISRDVPKLESADGICQAEPAA